MAQRAGLSGKAMLDDFADEVADIVDMAGGVSGGGATLPTDGIDGAFKRQRLSQRFGADLAPPSKRGRSGKILWCL